MTEVPTPALKYDVSTLFASGRLCLDFVNTSCQLRGAPLEIICDGHELRQWLLAAEGVFVKRLCPEEAVWSEAYIENVFPHAIRLRTALRDVVDSILENTTAPASALTEVNAVLRANPTYPQILPSEMRFEGTVTASRPETQWLGEIARDFVDLLCHSDLSLVRQCECQTCVRVFYDTTKNHKRRWCVEKCSSQTKAAAYYQRKKARTATGRSENETHVAGV